MKKDLIENLKQKLISEKNDILSNLLAEEEILNNSSDYVEDSGEMAFDNLDKDMVTKISSLEKETLNQIDLALKRIDAGKYTICASCGSEIDIQRLEALPYVQTCKECASKKK